MREDPIIIDSFAGGGGASTGIEMALGRSPDVAINHDPVAVAMHAVNHPGTLHLTNDIWGVDPMSVMPGRHIGAMWASPDCKHFSKAKGGKPLDRNIRDLAWVVVDWAEKRKPDVIFVENVEEFQTWGPVGNDGKPVAELAGLEFERWVKRLKKAGYKVDWNVSRACDYGAPTIRRRLLVIASRLGKPQWPKPTHGDPKSEAVRKGRLKPWRTAAECIDFSLPCPSIFDSAAEIFDKHGLRAVRPLADNTMARAARGMKRYVLDRDEPFLVDVAHASVSPDGRVKRWGDGIKPLSQPMGRVTAGGISQAVIVPSVATFYGHGGARAERTADLEEPLRTVTVENRHALVMPTLVQTGYGEREGQEPRALDIEKPLGTIVAGGVKHAVVSPVLTYAQQGGANRSIEEPVHTITASKKDQNAVIAPYLAQHNNDSRREGGVNPGRAVDEPLSTVTASGAQQGVVAPYMAKYYGTGDGQAIDDPMHTVTVKDRLGYMQAAISAPPFTPAHEARARQVADWLRAHGFWDDREFVTITVGGIELVVVDVGMRMLTPRELFNAQGFPPDYEIERDLNGRVFSKSDQVGRAGNSVSPPWAAAHVAANCRHLMRMQEAAE